MDLIDIVSANTIEELKQLVYSLKNLLHKDLDSIFKLQKSFKTLQEECFHLYKHSLLSRERFFYNDFGFLDKNIRYAEYIRETQTLTIKESQKLDEWQYIKQQEKSIRFISKHFRPEIMRAIFDLPIEYMLIEKTGIKLTSYESFVKLAKEIEKYDIVNCDEIISYNSFVTYDGRYNTYRLERALNFAYKRNKKIRLDPIISHNNTPSWLYALKNNSKNKEYVFNHMLGYIDKILTTVKEFNQKNSTNIVETIILLNEPINRLHGPFEARYSLRRDIGRHLYYWSKSWLRSENTRPGWMYILDIEQVCKLGTYVKTNSNINIMINECYLENCRKMEAFIQEVIIPIQKYEDDHNVKVIDLIGTEIHTDVDVPVCDIEHSLETLFLLGIPFEVTALDAYISQDKIDVATHQDITLYKSWYMHDLYKVFNAYNELLNCVTIWSINDYMNFMIDVLNKQIYKENQYNWKHKLPEKQYVGNVLGGYYDSQMNERYYLPEIGYQ